MIFLGQLDFRTPILPVLHPELGFLSERISRIAASILPLMHACPSARPFLRQVSLLSYFFAFQAERSRRPLLDQTRDAAATRLTDTVLDQLIAAISDPEARTHAVKAKEALRADLPDYSQALAYLKLCEKREPSPPFFTSPEFTSFKVAQEASEKAGAKQLSLAFKIFTATITFFFDPNRLPLPSFLKMLLLNSVVESLEGNFLNVGTALANCLKSPQKELPALLYKASYFFSFALNEGISSSFWRATALLTQALCDAQKTTLLTRTATDLSLGETAFHYASTTVLIAGRIFHAAQFHSSLPSSREDALSIFHTTGEVLRKFSWPELINFCLTTFLQTKA